MTIARFRAAALSFLLILPALGLLGACSDEAGTNGAGDNGRPFNPGTGGGGGGLDGVGATCAADTDCRGSLSCVEGRCASLCGNTVCDEPTPVCDQDREICVGCLAASDCTEGFLCQRTECVPACAVEGCPDGEMCDPASGGCISTDCSTYPACEQACDGDALVECASNAAGCDVPVSTDCAAEGATCQQTPGGPRCIQPCASDTDCPGDQTCESGTCRGTCTSDSDCEDGNACTTNACEDGTCTATEVDSRDDAPDDVAGDCRRPVCEGGQVRWIPHNEDVPPDDGIECTTPFCDNGVPSSRPDSGRCPAGEVCWPAGGGCTPRDEVPDNVCLPVQHDYDYFLDPVCGDAIADEGCPCEFGTVQRCFMGPPTARNIGACADGVQVCQNRLSPTWGPCTGSIVPAPEVCDGRDTACDGCVDNIPNCNPVLNCPDNEVSQPLRWYDLDATTFFGDAIEQVRWVVRPPPNSNAGVPESPTSPTTRFYMDVSGDYLVTIQIDDDKGGTFACSWIVSAQGEGLRVELVWDTFGNVDMDLHLQRHSATNRAWCNGANAGDCHYRNCRVTHNIDWGYAPSPDGTACNRNAGQTCPNPRLDIDNISGQDPENINVDNPNDGDRFRVMALMFSGSRNTYPVLSIYCGGALTSVFGEFPDRALVRSGGLLGSGCSNNGWRVADITMHVDAGTGRTTCSVEPLIVNGDWDIRTGTAF